MKKLLTLLLIGILILASGCSGTAAAAETPSPAPESIEGHSQREVLSPDGMRRGTDDFQARPADIRWENNENAVLGKITALSENTITLVTATMNKPDNSQGDRRTPPARDGSRPERPEGASSRPERRSDGSMPEGEKPEGANRNRFGGGFPGGANGLEFSSEEVSYTLPENIEITKGMGENPETLKPSDFKEGDIVRILLDENKQPLSIQVFGTNE